MIVRVLLLIAAGVFCAWTPVSADESADAGIQFTDVIILDDWIGAPPLAEGKLLCPGGEVEWLNPVTPICAATGRIHIRGASYAACTIAPADSRLTGVAVGIVNANFDADYSGPVWGTWMIVPYVACDPLVPVDPSVFDDPPMYWKGTWHGWRANECMGGQCIWLGDLELIGKGYGGAIDGVHFKGNEAVTTFTPAPVPWELLPPALGLPGGPEGVITATIKE